MIILDTNVLSEAMKPDPDPNVLAWLNEQASETLYLSSVALAELLFGIAAMPDGKRKKGVEEAFKGVMELFVDRILSFDENSAREYANLMSAARKKGLAINMADGYIASIAAANKMVVATRDINPFEAAGVSVINPWDAAGIVRPK